MLLGSLFGLLSEVRVPAGPDAGRTSPALSRTTFRFAAVGDRSLGLWEGERPVFVYNYGAITNAAAPKAQSHSAYLHPLYGLAGEILTDDFPKDHDYHRGLYWAWPHVKIADQEYDLWSLRGLRIEFKRWLAQDVEPSTAILGVENGWFIGDKKVMAEKVHIEVQPASEESRAIDFELTWTPTDQPITLWGAPGKSYGGFTLRFGPRSKTIITVPSGSASEDLLMTKLPWADLSGDLNKGTGKLSGAAIFVHPEHPDYPPTWMTRDYGVLAVGWPGVTPRTFPAGRPFSCRYRLWIHRSAPEAAQIQKSYEAYCGTAKLQGRVGQSGAVRRRVTSGE
ncbi:MAG: PmoA family protein [Verrucomicrobiales bacterium]|nr:PmoA family protein [Verrucomicrobiales bacterium]